MKCLNKFENTISTVLNISFLSKFTLFYVKEVKQKERKKFQARRLKLISSSTYEARVQVRVAKSTCTGTSMAKKNTSGYAYIRNWYDMGMSIWKNQIKNVV